MVYGMGATVQYNGTHIMSNELFIDSMGPSFAAGFNPVWNEVLRHVLSFPELALVRFRVMDYDRLSQDDFIGQFTLPFTSICTGESGPASLHGVTDILTHSHAGYRHVCLYNSKWEKIPGATLYLHINIGDWIGPPSNLRHRPKVKPLAVTRGKCLIVFSHAGTHSTACLCEECTTCKPSPLVLSIGYSIIVSCLYSDILVSL